MLDKNAINEVADLIDQPLPTTQPERRQEIERRARMAGLILGFGRPNDEAISAQVWKARAEKAEARLTAIAAIDDMSIQKWADQRRRAEAAEALVRKYDPTFDFIDDQGRIHRKP